jgi:hypothetical protein
MAELAVGGGCLTADMTDPDAVAKAIEALAAHPPLHDRLAAEARSREIDDWSDYARHFASLLAPNAATGDPSEHAARPQTEGPDFARIVARDAFFLRHRLSGLGSLGESRPFAPSDLPAPATQAALAAPQPEERRWLARLFGPRKLSVRKVQKSGLFNAQWYLAKYPDVRAAGLEPVEHFAAWGHKEGRSPGPQFDSAKYLADNPGLSETGLSPFEHYLRHGARA